MPTITTKDGTHTLKDQINGELLTFLQRSSQVSALFRWLRSRRAGKYSHNSFHG